MKHWTVLIDNSSPKKEFINALLNGDLPKPLKGFRGKHGMLFSSLAIDNIIEEEARRDYLILSTEIQSFETLSSGEQKKALLYHIIASKPEFMILDNPFDNLDIQFQTALKSLLKNASESIWFIQLASRTSDALPFIHHYGILTQHGFSEIDSLEHSIAKRPQAFQHRAIPAGPKKNFLLENPMIQCNGINVSYGDRPILKDIHWTIHKGDFWQLRGENGSGKTTLLSMIIGDNPKAYGQDLFLFGKKKGSGESVWDIKEKIGYYSPAITHKFNGRHSVEHMLISGFTDAIGLYTLPTDIQKRSIKAWLLLLELNDLKNTLFHKLSLGQQRLVMTARAMVKHPPVLILDEPTAGMDDASAGLLVALVNKIATETDTAIVFVSHRAEPGLHPNRVYLLEKTASGAVGTPLKP